MEIVFDTKKYNYVSSTDIQHTTECMDFRVVTCQRHLCISVPPLTVYV